MKLILKIQIEMLLYYFQCLSVYFFTIKQTENNSQPHYLLLLCLACDTNERSATHYHAQVGLPDNGRAIKVLSLPNYTSKCFSIKFVCGQRLDRGDMQNISCYLYLKKIPLNYWIICCLKNGKHT